VYTDDDLAVLSLISSFYTGSTCAGSKAAFDSLAGTLRRYGLSVGHQLANFQAALYTYLADYRVQYYNLLRVMTLQLKTRLALLTSAADRVSRGASCASVAEQFDLFNAHLCRLAAAAAHAWVAFMALTLLNFLVLLVACLARNKLRNFIWKKGYV
jgi:hypothetical protein